MNCDIDTIVNEAQCLMCLTPLQIRYVTIQIECNLVDLIRTILQVQ